MFKIKNKISFCIFAYIFALLIISFNSAQASVSGFSEMNKINKKNHKLVIGSNISKNAKYLFVLHSESGLMTNTKLTFKNFYQHFIYFSDRPNRVAGSYDTVTFLNDWNHIFLSDNPNVVLSFYDKKSSEYKDVTIEISNPVIDGDDVSFKIEKVIDVNEITNEVNPDLSIKFKSPSLFIDSIGCWIPSCYI